VAAPQAKAAKKNRLDDSLLSLGLAGDKKEAAAMIMAGEVQVNGQVRLKADWPVSARDRVTVHHIHPFVSRGAFKLEKAIRAFAVVPAGAKVLDVGISTGGFSDFLLKHGAAEVLGVDVNVSQVDYGLRLDPRLRLLKKNARFLQKQDVPFDPDLIIMDLSFISITAVLPALSAFAAARIVALVKPQFEAQRGQVGPGGVIRDPDVRRDIVLKLKKRIEAMHFAVRGFSSAGLKGRRGNQEYFFLLEYGKKDSIDDKMILDAAEI
jgi:23S rRNA (cytidine1920-2'-O)/16S rRNA (cytidine1409-2'-O)-methyltransferase